MMFLASLIYLIVVSEAATTNYEYHQKNSIAYTPHIFNSNILYKFFLPSNDTKIFQFKNQVYMVNDYLPITFMKRFTKTSGDFYFGRKKMMINFDDIVMEVHKSFQYPDKRVENIYFNQQVINKIIPFDSTYSLMAAQYNGSMYIGRYQYNTENIDFKYMSSLSCGKFLSLFKLLGDDLLLICDNRIYTYNVMTILYSTFINGNNIQQSCIKTYSKNATQTITIQYLMVTVDKLVKKYRRFLTFLNGTIANKTSFQLEIQFIDHSLNCTYDFINETHINILNNRSEVIIRNASIQDPFICSPSSKIPENAVKIQGTNDLFISNGSIYRVNYNNCSVTIVYKNLTNTTNQIKAWATSTNRFVIFVQNGVYINFPLDGNTNFSGIIDCQLIDNNLYYITDNQAKLLVVYDVNQKMNITNISLSNYSTKDIQMEVVYQNGNKYILLEINQTIPVVHQVWFFNETSNLLEKQTQYSHPVSFRKRTFIPSQPTFQLEEQQSGSIYLLNLLTLNNTMIVVNKKVDQYKWLKVFDIAIVLYIENDSRYFQLYRFTIDKSTKSITISQKPVVIKLDEVSGSIDKNKLFSIGDTKDSKQLIICFTDQSRSYFYNILDPIIKSTQISSFNIENNLKTSLLALRNTFFFILSNNSFISVTSDPNQFNIYTQQINLSPIFKDCLSINMSLFKKDDYDFIDFECQLELKMFIITYNISTIFTKDFHQHQRLMFFQKSIRGHAINNKGDMLVLDGFKGNDYLQFYQNDETSLLLISQIKILCRSQSGVYIVYNNTKQSQIYSKDLQTKKDYKIVSSPYGLSAYNCTIDDTGDWVIFYQKDNVKLAVFEKNSYLKQIQMNYPPLNVNFCVKKSVLIQTTNDLLLLTNIINGNILYLENNIKDNSIVFDLNQNFIAYSNDYSHVIICEQETCYPRLDQLSQNKVRRLHSDGRFVSYTSKTAGQFSTFGKQLISCEDGKYISNGVCLKCASTCNICEAQTGACLDCTFDYRFLISTICLCVIIVIMIGTFVKCWNKKLKSKQNTLLDRESYIAELENEREQLRRLYSTQQLQKRRVIQLNQELTEQIQALKRLGQQQQSVLMIN